MNFISNELVNEIQARCDIVEVISKYVGLSKKGKNYFGLCPFHDDHNASMSVSAEKQIYKCFSCGESGNVFTFVSKYNNISFNEAVILLGNMQGYNLKNNISLSNDNKYSKDYEIYDYAVKIYQNNLYSSLGKSALEYLENRKIDKDTIKKFKIGLSLNKSIITEYLLAKDYDINKLIDLGLTNEYNKDKFQNRIMFPLFDLRGRVVAFSGRIYNTKSDSKYINTMETEIFKKGNILYNYHNAKDNLKKTDYVIVMEGFMDVIRASTIGINNCVATMGTAFTKEHISLLKKMTDNIILCFDGDRAGLEATISSVNLLNDYDVNTKIIRLPDDLDPDEYILKYGKDSFVYQIENAISTVEFNLNVLKENKNLTDITDISKYIDEAIKELIKVKDDVLIELTLNKLSKNYNINYDILKNKYNNYLQNKKQVVKYNELKPKKEKLSQLKQAEYNLIYYMLCDYKVIKEVSNKVIYFPDDLIRCLYNEIESYYNKYGIINISSFISYISKDNNLLTLLNSIIAYINKEEYTYEEINDYIKVVNDYLKKDRIKTLEIELKKEIDPIKKVEILNKIMEIKGVKS